MRRSRTPFLKFSLANWHHQLAEAIKVVHLTPRARFPHCKLFGCGHGSEHLLNFWVELSGLQETLHDGNGRPGNPGLPLPPSPRGRFRGVSRGSGPLPPPPNFEKILFLSNKNSSRVSGWTPPPPFRRKFGPPLLKFLDLPLSPMHQLFPGWSPIHVLGWPNTDRSHSRVLGDSCRTIIQHTGYRVKDWARGGVLVLNTARGVSMAIMRVMTLYRNFHIIRKGSMVDSGLDHGLLEYGLNFRQPGLGPGAMLGLGTTQESPQQQLLYARPCFGVIYGACSQFFCSATCMHHFQAIIVMLSCLGAAAVGSPVLFLLHCTSISPMLAM